jgi:catechol 1,2-dioxygenase
MTPPTTLTLRRLLALETTVLEQIRGDDPRLIGLMTSLIRHTHAFVREARPTPEEWATAIDFLVRVGQASDTQRNELILLFDMLGLTSAVDEVNFPGIDGATPSSVEGPFHSRAPRRANGAWIAGGPERHRGSVMVGLGSITDVEGRPLARATVDIWQADDAGHYDSQDPQQPPSNLRGLFNADEHGAFWFRSVLPSSYPVPTDGPAGELLRALGRHPMRPAHVHLHVTADGFRPVTTHIFVAGDPYLDSDAAFAVKDDLIAAPVRVDDPSVAARHDVEPPFWLLEFAIRLVPTERR